MAWLASTNVWAVESAYDGRWSVDLVCPDTTDKGTDKNGAADKGGLVKGYEYTFFVTIEGGMIRGEYGAPGHPASVVYTGTVSDDGTLEIAATGNTGRSEYSVGKVARGTTYRYTMQGRLTGRSGQATRREVRPCTANFKKS